MEKIQTRGRLTEGERGESGIGFIGGVALVSWSVFIGILIGKGVANVDDHVKDIQIYNSQLAAQLEKSTPEPITGLSLDTSDHFSFNTTATDGHQEMCSGDYAVKQAAAMISGKITCKEVTVLSQ